MGWVETRPRRAPRGHVRKAWHHWRSLLWRAIHCWAPVLHLRRVRSTGTCATTTSYICSPLRVHGLLLLRRQLLLSLLLILLWVVWSHLLLCQCLWPLQELHTWLRLRLPEWRLAGRPHVLRVRGPIWWQWARLRHGVLLVGGRYRRQQVSSSVLPSIWLPGWCCRRGPQTSLCCCHMVRVTVKVHCCCVNRLGTAKGVRLLGRGGGRGSCSVWGAGGGRLQPAAAVPVLRGAPPSVCGSTCSNTRVEGFRDVRV